MTDKNPVGAPVPITYIFSDTNIYAFNNDGLHIISSKVEVSR